MAVLGLRIRRRERSAQVGLLIIHARVVILRMIHVRDIALRRWRYYLIAEAAHLLLFCG